MRYRVATEKIGPQGARIRCQKCSEVFRVEPPEAEAEIEVEVEPIEFVARAVVAEADPDRAKALVNLLETWGIEAVLFDSGARALLDLHRNKADLAVLGPNLPGVPANEMAEILRRNADLQEIPLVRLLCDGETATAPEFDADHQLDPADVPDALAELLEDLGVGQRPHSSPAAAPKPLAPKQKAPTPAPEPKSAAAPEPAPATSDDPDVKAAERLARIVVSDIVLYNEEKFAQGARDGNVAAVLAAELVEASAMFRERVSEELRAERDFLVEELERRATKLAG
jgi:predicted Zn finger-like uncharacterized protein